MNYMKQVAEMLGVELREMFDIKYEDGRIAENCCICEGGLFYEDMFFDASLRYLLNGTAEIIKQPFRPKYHDKYWHINKCGETENLTMEDDTFDYMAMYMGNCFRSEAEAEEHKDEIIDKFREVKN